jgi:hypothetical protein
MSESFPDPISSASGEVKPDGPPSSSGSGETKTKEEAPDDAAHEIQSLRAENQRLQEQLEELRRNQRVDETETENSAAAVDDDDGGSVEDVTEEALKAKNKKKQVEVIELSSDSESADDEVSDASDSESEEDESLDGSDHEYDYKAPEDDTAMTENDKKPGVRSGRGPRKEKLPPLEVLMKTKDVPFSPGTKSEIGESTGIDEGSALVNGSGQQNADKAVKDRVIKLLNTGFHKESNEHEAKNAMKLAQRLMRKHNLSQVLLLEEREEKEGSKAQEETLKGGIVSVRIVNRKTRRPTVMARWIASLMHPIAKNFDVKSYYSVARGWRCSVSFYGIYTNCQLAGYAFKVATERISQMMADYKPDTPRWSFQSVNTKTARLSYAIGMVRGISDDIDRNIDMEKERQERELEKKRMAATRGEAYVESDDEGGEGSGYTMAVPEKPKGAFDPKVSDILDDSANTDALFDHVDDPSLQPLDRIKRDLAKKIVNTTTPENVDVWKEEEKAHWKGKLPSEEFEKAWPEAEEYALEVLKASQNDSFPKSKTELEALRREKRLHAIEQEKRAAIVLVNHREKVADDVLKENGTKLFAGRKRKRIDIDRRSYKRGVVDSKEIDINQRAIRDGVKVKTEKG